jgi:hypothetical protein
MLFEVGNVREFRVARGPPSLANGQPPSSSLVSSEFILIILVHNDATTQKHRLDDMPR